MASLPSCLTDIGKRQIVARGHSLGLLAKWTVRWANASNKQRFATYSGLLLLSGCGYTVGNGFSPDIRTVSVPIFENATFRRGIEVQITEAVQKEIQKRTPYRLAKGLDADTRLTGRIVQISKNALTENQFDDPRELQFSLMVVVKWENLRTGEILAQQETPLSPTAIPLTTQAEVAPEVGQSLATGTQDATDQLARQIVNMMEAW
ncbi:MAG: LptE family protein [Planctomycetales bacterium]|jgi:hypothetical protein|nr:LptE family protein [Planctomycetales bacterium]